MKRLLAVLVLLSSGIAALQVDGTFAGLTDPGTGTASFEAEDPGRRTHDPWHAYEDVDDDGFFTEGVDVAIEDAAILDGSYTVQKPQHGLVIPKSVGPVDVDGDIAFEAGNKGNLTVEVRLTASQAIELSAGQDLQLDGLVAQAGDRVGIEAGGQAVLSDAYLTSETGDVTVSAKDRFDGLGLQAEANGSIELENRKDTLGLADASLHAGDAVSVTSKQGTVNADRSSLRAAGPLDVDAGSDVRVKQATLESGDEIVLLAGTPNDAVFVQDARVRDANDTAKAGPGSVEIVGEPAEGAVDHEG